MKDYDKIRDRPKDKTKDDPLREVEKKESGKMELHDWLQCIVTAIVFGIFIFVFVGRTIGVQGDSMRPTFHYNDRVIMSNLFYTPGNGDVIIFHAPHETFSDPLVKRVIAVAGQTVDIDFESGYVYVDDHRLIEPYTSGPTTREHDFDGPVTVPDGYVFVLGDNRNATADSRDNRVGMVDTRYILGRVLFIVTPGRGADGRDWSRIGPVRSG